MIVYTKSKPGQRLNVLMVDGSEVTQKVRFLHKTDYRLYKELKTPKIQKLNKLLNGLGYF